jgi:ubiquinone/menaquinone biosynthesis C-methylase UbiE
MRNNLNPEPLLQMSMSFAPARVLQASVQLDLFSHIAAGNMTGAEIARAANASERGTRMLLDALVVFQLLAKTGDRYELTPLSAKYLVRDSPEFLGAIVEGEHLWQAWGNLTETVRKGHPIIAVEQQEKAEQFFPGLIRGLHVMNAEPARRLAQALGAGQTRSGLRVLDVACGSGVWSIPIAEADREARFMMQDFPGVLEHTREYLRRQGLEERCDFLPGDLKKVDFGEGLYDIALLGNIVHSEGEGSSRDLFKRVHRALKPGGKICVIDMIPNEDRTGPPFAIIFAINMLVNTAEGSTFTLAEYTGWLNDAGFSRVETVDIGFHSPVIIGVK